MFSNVTVAFFSQTTLDAALLSVPCDMTHFHAANTHSYRSRVYYVITHLHVTRSLTSAAPAPVGMCNCLQPTLLSTSLDYAVTHYPADITNRQQYALRTSSSPNCSALFSPHLLLLPMLLLPLSLPRVPPTTFDHDATSLQVCYKLSIALLRRILWLMSRALYSAPVSTWTLLNVMPMGEQRYLWRLSHALTTPLCAL
jgi:hypothetical protein